MEWKRNKTWDEWQKYIGQLTTKTEKKGTSPYKTVLLLPYHYAKLSLPKLDEYFSIHSVTNMFGKRFYEYAIQNGILPIVALTYTFFWNYFFAKWRKGEGPNIASSYGELIGDQDNQYQSTHYGDQIRFPLVLLDAKDRYVGHVYIFPSKNNCEMRGIRLGLTRLIENACEEGKDKGVALTLIKSGVIPWCNKFEEKNLMIYPLVESDMEWIKTNKLK